MSILVECFHRHSHNYCCPCFQIASLQLRLNSEFCGHEDIEKVKLHAEAERLQGIQLEHGRDALEARQLLEEKSGELKAVTEDLLQSLDSIGKLQVIDVWINVCCTYLMYT